ncbi:MAG TPA: hypothetical protein EYP46_01655 [Hadesarchaea archaeon]|nr:hypothetical protein [Hadesarchaea archaeon]
MVARKAILILNIIAIAAGGVIYFYWKPFDHQNKPLLGSLPTGDIVQPMHLVVATGDGGAYLWWENPPDPKVEGYRIYLDYAVLEEAEAEKGKNHLSENDFPYIEISLAGPPSGFDPEHPRLKLTGLQNNVQCRAGVSAWGYENGVKVQSGVIWGDATASSAYSNKGVAILLFENGIYDNSQLVRDALNQYLEVTVGELDNFGLWNSGIHTIHWAKLGEIPSFGSNFVSQVQTFHDDLLNQIDNFIVWVQNESGASGLDDITASLDVLRSSHVGHVETVVETSENVLTLENLVELKNSVLGIKGKFADGAVEIERIIQMHGGEAGWNEINDRFSLLCEGYFQKTRFLETTVCKFLTECMNEVYGQVKEFSHAGARYFIFVGDDLVLQELVRPWSGENLLNWGAVSFVPAPADYSEEQKIQFIVDVFSRYTEFHENPSVFFDNHAKEVLCVVDLEFENYLQYETISFEPKQLYRFVPRGYAQVVISNYNNAAVGARLNNKPIILSVKAHGFTDIQGIGLYDQYTTRENWEHYCETHGTPTLFVDMSACFWHILNRWPETYLGCGVLAYSPHVEWLSSYWAYPTLGDLQRNLWNSPFPVFGDILAHMPFEDVYLQRFSEPSVQVA